MTPTFWTRPLVSLRVLASASRSMPYRRRLNMPISVYRLGEMPIQSCGQSVSAPRGKAGARLNAHTELRAKRQRSAREAIYRNRPIQHIVYRCSPGHMMSFVPSTESLKRLDV